MLYSLNAWEKKKNARKSTQGCAKFTCRDSRDSRGGGDCGKRGDCRNCRECENLKQVSFNY